MRFAPVLVLTTCLPENTNSVFRYVIRKPAGSSPCLCMSGMRMEVILWVNYVWPNKSQCFVNGLLSRPKIGFCFHRDFVRSSRGGEGEKSALPRSSSLSSFGGEGRGEEANMRRALIKTAMRPFTGHSTL